MTALAWKALALLGGLGVKYWRPIAEVIAALYMRLLKRRVADQKEEISELRAKEAIAADHTEIQKRSDETQKNIRRADDAADFQRVWDNKK